MPFNRRTETSSGAIGKPLASESLITFDCRAVSFVWMRRLFSLSPVLSPTADRAFSPHLPFAPGFGSLRIPGCDSGLYKSPTDSSSGHSRRRGTSQRGSRAGVLHRYHKELEPRVHLPQRGRSESPLDPRISRRGGGIDRLQR